MGCPEGANFNGCNRKCKCCERGHPCFGSIYDCGSACPEGYVLMDNGCRCVPECSLVKRYRMTVQIIAGSYDYCRTYLNYPGYPLNEPVTICGTTPASSTSTISYNQVGNQINFEWTGKSIAGCGDAGVKLTPGYRILRANLCDGETRIVSNTVDNRGSQCHNSLTVPENYAVLISAVELD